MSDAAHRRITRTTRSLVSSVPKNRRALSTVVSFLFTVLLTTPIYAEWAFVPLEEIVEKSDLIVVGRLSNVVTYTLGEHDYGRGLITIDRTLWGQPPEEGKVALQWTNRSQLICPRVEHAGGVGGHFVWLLNVDEMGYVHAGYPTRRSPLSSEGEILGYLKTRKSPPKEFAFSIPAATLAQPHREYIEQSARKMALILLIAATAIGVFGYAFRRIPRKVGPNDA